MFADIKARLMSGVVLVGFCSGVLTFGVWGIKLLMTLVALGMMYEWLRISGCMSWHNLLILCVCVFVPLICVFFREPLLAVGIMFLLVSSTIFLREVYGVSMLKVGFGALVVGMPTLSVFACLALCQNGFFMIIWVSLIIISMDVGGYFWGSWIGGPKLCPSISPKKTWSGFIGGLVLAVFTSVIAYVYYFENMMPSAILWRIILLGTLAVLGDLLESYVKRLHGVKQSGRILPGHGGVLDRFDGYILAMPALHLLLYIDGYFMVSFGEFEKVL